jgi:hypothetical protein
MARARSRAAPPIPRRAAPGTRPPAPVPGGSGDGRAVIGRVSDAVGHPRPASPRVGEPWAWVPAPAALAASGAGRCSRADSPRWPRLPAQRKRRWKALGTDPGRHATTCGSDHARSPRPVPAARWHGSSLPSRRCTLRGNLRSRCSSATPWRARRRWGGRVALGRVRVRESAATVHGRRARRTCAAGLSCDAALPRSAKNRQPTGRGCVRLAPPDVAPRRRL